MVSILISECAAGFFWSINDFPNSEGLKIMDEGFLWPTFDLALIDVTQYVKQKYCKR